MPRIEHAAVGEPVFHSETSQLKSSRLVPRSYQWPTTVTDIGRTVTTESICTLTAGPESWALWSADDSVGSHKSLFAVTGKASPCVRTESDGSVFPEKP